MGGGWEDECVLPRKKRERLMHVAALEAAALVRRGREGSCMFPCSAEEEKGERVEAACCHAERRLMHVAAQRRLLRL